jgi:hypothetical protein
MKITSKRKRKNAGSSCSCCGGGIVGILSSALILLALIWGSLFWNVVVVGSFLSNNDGNGSKNININSNNKKENTIVGATPVYATRVQWASSSSNGDGNGNDDDGAQHKPMVVDALYALPDTSIDSLFPPRGIVILLHACTHNAFKFFSPSEKMKCPECVGLSEELRIARLCLQKRYAVVAISSQSSSGCWNESVDLPRLRLALSKFRQVVYPGDNTNNNSNKPVIAIGASSGGTMAAKLLVSKEHDDENNNNNNNNNSNSKNLAQAALVMVMGLGRPLVEKLKQNSIIGTEAASPLLFLAPMPRDRRTTRLARENAEQLISLSENNSTRLDDTTCGSFPVTESYLRERVPDMTPIAAHRIVTALAKAGHLHPDTLEFLKDPTQSDWRDVLLAIPTTTTLRGDEHPPMIMAATNAAASSAMVILWGRFPLAPGKSPLAKALHRAWAFHEYCSEVVVPALEFFEERLGTRQ